VAQPTSLDKFPSFVPVNFVQRTLQRLLPSPDVVAKLDKARLVQLARLQDDLTQLIQDDPVRFFQPSPGGQYDFLTTNDPTIQGLYFFAGNKSGKTTGAAILVSENAAGTPLWGRDFRTKASLLLGGREPIRVAAFCEDFSTHEETIVPTILSWTPRNLLHARPLERGPSGNLTAIHYKNGSVCKLRTYDQGYAKAEGKDYNIIWDDEPPPRDIYTAQFRGLVAQRGRLIIAATLLSETWLYDDLEQPFVKAFEASSYDNKWLDSVARGNFESLLDEDERAIRIYGRPTNLSGKIYPSFKDSPPYVIPLAQRIWDPLKEQPYPVIMAVDPHERKPLYCLWGWVTPMDRVVWFKYALIPSATLTEQFHDISICESEISQPIRLVVMDPNRGAARQIDGRSWQEEFETRGYDVLLGEDNLNFGHSELRETLANIPDRPPMMQWMETCRGVGGPIHQMLHYTWDDFSRTIKRNRSLKETPKDKYKDFPDLHRYVAVAVRSGAIGYKFLTDQRGLVIDLFDKKSRARGVYF